MTPRVIGHRGASAHRPENTIAAFEAALHAGADGLELDVRLSADEIPFVFHDETLARAGRPELRTESLTARALGRLDPARALDKRLHGQHIPTLEEVFRGFGDRTHYLVEIKTPDDRARGSRLVEAVARLVVAMGLEENVELLSFDRGCLDSMARLLPGLPRVLNVKPPERLGPELRSQLTDLAALSADVRTLTRGFAEEIASIDLPLYVYTCNRASERDLARDCGAAAILSDDPAWLRETLS